MKKNICLYISTFIYKFGGTESYAANLISALQHIDTGFYVTVITENFKNTPILTSSELVERLKNAYGTMIDILRFSITYIPAKEYKGRLAYFIFQNRLNTITRKFDIFIYCSRGLLTGKAKSNIAVIHFPMVSKTTFGFYKKYPVSRFIAEHCDRKFRNSYNAFLPNSDFTASWLKKLWNIPDSKIFKLYPPVTPINVNPEQAKEKYIFVCSRIEKSKCIEALIDAYLSSKLLTSTFKLIIAGSVKNEEQDYIDFLKQFSGKVTFIFDPERKQIEELYQKSMIFWHAKGFSSDESKQPYLMEHFGITTVEAMSAGCVPVVINKGGQKEIVAEDCGYRWNTLEELISYTEELATYPDKLSNFSKAALKRSELYTMMAYNKNLQKIIMKLYMEGKF